MAGMFEVFLDSDSLFRFRLKAPDGTVIAVSGAFGDKSAAAAGITAVRECAGTGLVTDLSAAARDHRATAPAPQTAAATAEPSYGEQHVPAGRVRAFSHATAVLRRVSGPQWTGAV